jgi:hypothetical protein
MIDLLSEFNFQTNSAILTAEFDIAINFTIWQLPADGRFTSPLLLTIRDINVIWSKKGYNYKRRWEGTRTVKS